MARGASSRASARRTAFLAGDKLASRNSISLPYATLRLGTAVRALFWRVAFGRARARLTYGTHAQTSRGARARSFYKRCLAVVSVYRGACRGRIDNMLGAAGARLRLV